jgi:hypothetical protein
MKSPPPKAGAFIPSKAKENNPYRKILQALEIVIFFLSKIKQSPP